MTAPAIEASAASGIIQGTGTRVTTASATATVISDTKAPAFKRTMGLRSVTMMGLAYMTPIIALGTFGVIASDSHGAAAMSYLVATIAMLFTANSYGRMSLLHPESGSAYTYVGKTISRKLGFLVGWAVLLDYMFLPMVVWLIGASYLNALFPTVPMWAWIVGYIVLDTGINILGVNVADKINFVLMAFQALVIVLFVGLSIRSVLGGTGTGTLLSLSPFTGQGSSISAVVAGAAVAAYSFLGFDAVTTMSEETKDPKRTMPRAIMLVAMIGGLIFIGVAYFTQLVHPGGAFVDSSSAAYEIAMTIGGNLFTSVFVAGLCIGQFTSGIATQASASRLMYVMGRDGVLPKKMFGRLSKRFGTPVPCILIIAAVGLIALFLDVATSTSFVNFGAFTSFTLVNVSLIVAYAKSRRNGGSDELGSDGRSVARNVVFPLLGAFFCFYLLMHLDVNAIVLGLSWLAIGVVILGFLTKGFRTNPPEYAADAA